MYELHLSIDFIEYIITSGLKVSKMTLMKTNLIIVQNSILQVERKCKHSFYSNYQDANVTFKVHVYVSRDSTAIVFTIVCC